MGKRLNFLGIMWMSSYTDCYKYVNSSIVQHVYTLFVGGLMSYLRLLCLFVGGLMSYLRLLWQQIPILVFGLTRPWLEPTI